MINRFAVRLRSFLVLIGLSLAFQTGNLSAEEVILLKNGLSSTGTIFGQAAMTKNPFAAAANNGGAEPIIMVDDGLRRLYMYRRGMLNGDPKPARGIDRTIEFGFKPPQTGKIIAGLGPLLGVSPFNKYGRRAVRLSSKEGPISVLQGISELNSRYAKVEGLKDRPSYIWDMRVASSSLDSATLRAIFDQRVKRPGLTPEQRFDTRLDHVRFFIEAERFGDARAELRALIKEFPDAKDMQAKMVRITELEAQKLITEAEDRVKIGQEQFARKILAAFQPQNVGRVTRAKVQQVVGDLSQKKKDRDGTLAKLKAHIGQLDPGQAAALGGIVAEIEANLSMATFVRLADYNLQSEVATVPVGSKVALAISGWLLGQGQGIQNLSVATSMIQVRELAREYLGCDNAVRRKAILDELSNLEGAQPEYVSRILPQMKPPKELSDDSAHQIVAGMYTVDLADPQQSKIAPRYVIQLPPEYDPLREYPCILALHPPTGTPEQQLDWWAGQYNSGLGFRSGHATRNGYIVVAPVWTRPGQSVYEYTPREHQRVLVSLRDAMRRTSIDADKVFIVGHGEGGTAAWDIAVSHPDHWAGVIPISSNPGKTIIHYSANCEHVPIYTVNGQLDRVHTDNNYRFSGILDDYLNVRADAMVVFYRGWGFGFFYDEIHYLFDWMNVALHRRKAIPQKLNNVSMREGDDYFWWLEMDGMKEGTTINPILWDQAERIRGKKIDATVGANNSIRINQAPAERFMIWMRPDMGIDLNKRITLHLGTRSVGHVYGGGIAVMLEDARQRADRKRPFWTRRSLP